MAVDTSGPETDDPFEPVDTTPVPLRPEQFFLGQQVDVLDSVDRWAEAEIVKIDKEKEWLYITFLYWGDAWDMWLPQDSPNIAPLHTHTYADKGCLKPRQRIDVYDLIKRKHLEAFVTEAKSTEVLVHFKGYHAKYDEWIPRDSDRVRQYGIYKVIHKKLLISRSASSSAGRGLPRALVGGHRIKQWQVPTDASRSAAASRFMCYNDEHGTSTYDGMFDSSESRIPENMNCSSAIPTSEHIDSKAHHEQSDQQLVDRTRQITALSDCYNQYVSALAIHQLEIYNVEGDGNCLFRSVAHQIYGDVSLHGLVRSACMDYMESQAEFFSQFVVGGLESFGQYIAVKRRDHVWGDDPEIQAMCELYGRPAEIWAYDPQVGAQKLRTFHENIGLSSSTSSSSSAVALIRISYYGGGHYDSIICRRDNVTYSNVLHSDPGVAERISLERNRHRVPPARIDSTIRIEESTPLPTDQEQVQQSLLNDVAVQASIHASDREQTEQITLDTAIEASRVHDLSMWEDDLDRCLRLSMGMLSANRPNTSTSSDYLCQDKGSVIGVGEDKKEEGILPVDAASTPLMKGPMATKRTLECDGADISVPSSAKSSCKYVDVYLSDGGCTDPMATPVEDTLLQSVSDQSEREYLEKALTESLASATNHHLDDTAATDVAMYEEALQLSLKEADAHSTFHSLEDSTTLPIEWQAFDASDSSIVNQQHAPLSGFVDDEDSELQRAIRMSLM